MNIFSNFKVQLATVSLGQNEFEKGIKNGLQGKRRTVCSNNNMAAECDDMCLYKKWFHTLTINSVTQAEAQYHFEKWNQTAI